MNNKIISIDTLKYYNDKISNYVDEKVSDAVDNLELGELNAILVDTDAVADDPIVSDYVTENELEVTLKDKQDKLVSGTNIKTINGESILGEGDLKIDGSIETYDVPFSTGELIAVKEVRESAIKANFDELTQAIKDKKLIIFTNDVGVTVASAKYNSKRKCTYLTVIDHRGVAIYVKWNDGDTELPAENIELFDIGGIDYRLGLLEEDIPAAVTESTVSGWGFTKNTGTYSKPSTGIPKSDLASDVQTSLGKADTALQSHQDISGKQDKLVSGTNIKTINGESIVGSGDITISGGGSSGGSGAYPVEVVSLVYADEPGLHPNTYYIIDDMILGDGLYVTLNEPTDNSIVNEYIFEFHVENASWGFSSLTLPDTIKFANDVYPEIKGGYTYVISIINNLAIFAEFAGDEIIGGVA